MASILDLKLTLRKWKDVTLNGYLPILVGSNLVYIIPETNSMSKKNRPETWIFSFKIILSN